MPHSSNGFARNVLEAYRSSIASEVALSKSVRASTQTDVLGRAMGHPAFANLPLGGTGHCDAAVAFLDLSDFTARTFWDSPDSMVRLARAVLTQLVEVVSERGGHVLGLRGDGVFTCFGGPDSQVPAVDAITALGACAFALDATQGALNNLLRASGIEPVQLRGGADYGRLDFVRTGTEESSEVNVIGFAANFAAKCEKIANSWEFVVGEGLAQQLPEPELLLTKHLRSPKSFQRNHEVRTYPFYDVRWRSLLPHLAGVREELAGAPSSRIRIV